MGLNDLMHPRNRYKESPPDFNELAVKYPEFKKFTRENSSGSVGINFKDPEALRALTCATLDHDFGLKVELPLDRLIPTVPLRLNYILWLEDLLQSLSSEGVLSSQVWGVDIGAGASCIYPLLGNALDGWNFIATEIDESSISYAQRNVAQNGLDDKIKVELVTPNCYLQKPLEGVTQKITFCMCNPPFFSSEDDALLGASRTDKRPLPTSVCTGNTNETVTGGGEVEFVKGIIRDSMKLKEKISWYTTMLGKKSSVSEVLAFLKKNKIYSVTTTEFCQGKTRRWGVAWTFLKGILSTESPLAKRSKHHHKAKPLSFVINCCTSNIKNRMEQTANRIQELLRELKIDVQESQSPVGINYGTIKHVVYRCTAIENTWSNQRRKRREQLRRERLGTTAPSTSSAACEQSTGETGDRTLSNTNTESDKNVPESSTLKANTCGQSSNASNSASSNTPMSETNDSSKLKLERNDEQSAASLVASETKLLEGHDVELETIPSPLCIFSVCVEAGAERDAGLAGQTGVNVSMEFIEGEDKNNMYQIYQYLQNKILKGL